MRIKHKCILISVPILLFLSCGKEETRKIDLAGPWQFEIDSLDQGVSEKWFHKDPSNMMSLPGSIAARRAYTAVYFFQLPRTHPSCDRPFRYESRA